MEQLGALDNLMVSGEMPNLPLHMSAMLIYQTRGVRGTDRLFEQILARLDDVSTRLFPILRCRVERLPLDMDRAYWVTDEHFSGDYHVARVALPGGRDWEALYGLLARFHARPLDMARPLWELQLVDGLDNLRGIPAGSTAVFFKIHHGVMDGTGAMRLVRSLHDLEPGDGAARTEAADAASASGERDFSEPSLLSRYSRAGWHALERPVDLAATLVKMLPAALPGGGADGARGPGIAETPATTFNQAIAADRVIGHVRLSMRTLRRLEKTFDCTINDIALAAIGGALRDFLLEREELPAQSLICLMPIDLRRPGEAGEIGNHVTAARISLATDLPLPRQRLRAIRAATSASKREHRRRGGGSLMDLIDEVPPAIILWLGHWLIDTGLMEKMPRVANTVVTNVPGFRGEATLAGARVLDYLGLGPLAPNTGLFHTVSSTRDHVNVTFLSTRGILGNGAAYRSALQRNWEKLRRL